MASAGASTRDVGLLATVRHTRIGDVLLAGALGMAAAIAVVVLFGRVSPYILHYSTWDFWFESDPAAAARQMVDRFSSEQHRTSHHPLIAIELFAPVWILRFLGLGTMHAIAGALAIVGAAWAILVFAALRGLGLGRTDATVYVLLAAFSASVVFWFPVPESFALGAVSLAGAVLAAALDERRRLPDAALVAASAATLSCTSTNWAMGLALLYVARPARRAHVLAVTSVLVVAACWWMQSWIFPAAASPLALTTPAETEYIFNPAALGIGAKVAAVLFHAMVMPELATAYGFRLSVQASWPGQGSLLAVTGAVGWFALCMLGLRSASGLWRRQAVRVLALGLLAQAAVAMVFGVETFMYTAHVGPLLVMLCAITSLTRWRPVGLAGAAVVATLAFLNNTASFERASQALAATYARERAFTRAVSEHTAPDQLILCGREAAAATGEEFGRSDVTGSPPAAIIDPADPDTCAFVFDEVGLSRRGWVLPFEDWSPQAVEVFRTKGARYFASPYRYGLDRAQALVAALDRDYRALVRTPDMVIYDLAGSRPGGGSVTPRLSAPAPEAR